MLLTSRLLPFRSSLLSRSFFSRSPPPRPYETYNPVMPAEVSQQISWEFIPKHIVLPPYARGPGTPHSPGLTAPEIKEPEVIDLMREAGQLAKKVLEEAGKLARVGVTTEEIDTLVMELCLENNAYPSTLNYRGFPKAVCTSVNNVVCHGIPDSRPLEDGDIINIDVTVFLNGVHGDCSRTFPVGDKVCKDGLRLLKVAEECLHVGLESCGPGLPIRNIGRNIGLHAQENGFTVVSAFIGHGIGTYFHGPPDIIHERNNYPGLMKPGMTFTVEPAISEGSDKFAILEDGWTAVSIDSSRSAQFEHTVLITEQGCELLTA